MICCIFGGADITDYSRINIPQDAVIIAADSGYRHCIKLGIKPDCIVGDFDSWEHELPDNCEIIRAPKEKDDTDLLLAVKIGLKKNIEKFHIYGADGGRMGHTIAAVQTLSYIDSCYGEGIIFGSSFRMQLLTKGENRFCNDGFSYISLFSLTETSEAHVSGLKYSGKIELCSNFPLGVSNEFISDTAVIKLLNGKILAVFEL